MSADTKQSSADFGVIGLGVMGASIAQNIEDHEFRVALFNRNVDKAKAFVEEHSDKKFVAAETLEDFVAVLEPPRRILLMIKAGKPVDTVLETLKDLLDAGDIVIDGGNSAFEDTRRRESFAREAGFNFVGMGVSGGEEGARFGPSIMPGGSKEAWTRLQPVLESIAAKTDSGPCVTHVGPDGAGHFVKTVHNGIEYGDMQLIAEAYDILHRRLGLEDDRLADVFAEWNRGELGSFLIELTAKVLSVRDEKSGGSLVNVVMDKAGQKGTGRWTAQIALQLGVPTPTIAAAVDARVLSSMKSERVEAAKRIAGPKIDPREEQGMIAAVRDGLLAAKICSYAQGMHLIAVASREFDWNVNRGEVARIWKGGCIIRARLLDDIMRAFERDPELANLLLDEKLGGAVQERQAAWRRVVGAAQEAGIPVPAMAASLAYFDSYRTARLPQNLTQAQRDAFGAHTYERTDAPDEGFVHSDWLGMSGSGES